MVKAINAFLLMLAGATEKELVRQVEYLKAENKILRSKLPGRVTVTPAERARLVKLGKKVGSAIRDLITIVRPRTFARWLKTDKNPAKKQAKRGRPRTPEETREIVLRLAREMDNGFTRLLGELRKLGINIGKTTIRNILKEHRIDPGPKRMTGGTWDQFITRHAQTLWACDFVTEKVWTIRGRMDCFFLFFIHIETRQVWVSPATFNPTATWTAQQARNFVMWLHEQNLSIRFLLRDGDSKFQSMFDLIIETEDADVIKIPYRSPNMNAFAERWVQSVRNECMNHFIIVGTSHFSYLINEYVDHYNTERPHQGRENMPLTGDWSELTITGEIKCKKRLGGVLRHYCREAA